MTVAVTDVSRCLGAPTDEKSAGTQPRSYIQTRIAGIRKRLADTNADLGKPCSWSRSQDCWLLDVLASCNRFLHPVGVRVVETRPGELGVFDLDYDWDTDVGEDALHDAAHVFTRLTSHRCVQTVSFRDCVFLQRPPFVLSVALSASPNLRHLRLGAEQFRTINDDELVEGFEALSNLESFELVHVRVNRRIASAIKGLLRRCSECMKKVTIADSYMSQRCANAVLKGLLGCASLTDVRFEYELNNSAIDRLARLVRTSGTLRTLSLRNAIVAARPICPLAQAFAANQSLCELNLQNCDLHRDFFAGLEENRTLQKLDLGGCDASGTTMNFLAAALAKNSSLRHLVLAQCGLRDFDMEKLAEAIVGNRTLETVDLSFNEAGIRGVSAVCRALRKNRTLKKVSFGSLGLEAQFRAALNSEMFNANCYDRVQVLDWTELDLPNVVAALALSPLSLVDLGLECIFSMASLHACAVFDSIATNTTLRELRIDLTELYPEPAKRGAFCRAIARNGSVRRLVLGRSAGHLVPTVCEALVENRTVTELSLDCDSIGLRGVRHMAHMLARNRTLTKVEFTGLVLRNTYVQILSRGLAKNCVVTEFTAGSRLRINRALLRISETLGRNVRLLNDAVRFVLRARVDKRCAEAFEKLSNSSALGVLLAQLTGRDDAGVGMATKSSAEYICCNYLVVTGVVRERVECNLAPHTQADALNRDCWRAIASFLKVSDVVS